MNIEINFEGIVGQEQVVKKLKRDLKSNKIAHAYLFEGVRGLGKKNMALEMASALACYGDNKRPCRKCSSCIKVASGNYPDIKTIEEDRIIKIDTIRELIGEMQLKPYEGRCKVCIICDADKMNIEAQNALLKTLEEPPSYAVLILLTAKSESLLPTIVSRCQVINLYPVNPEVVKHYLIKNKNIDEEQAHMLSVFSGGIVGRAIELLDNPDFYHRREKIIKICNKLLTPNLFNILEQITFFEEQKLHIEEIFDLMISWYRDLFIYIETENIELITNIDKKEEIIFQATKTDFAKIRDVIFIIEKTRSNLGSNVQFHLNIEVMLLNIQEVLLNGNSGRSEV
ncbi:MAG TPA: DNA polymerase III subunit delta' [Oscillospiraceae bacterium]|nr:DNA polymerase III subunit delta' [Oscillospiraceae bacterium]